MAPHTPQRSERPGKAVTLLDTPTAESGPAGPLFGLPPPRSRIAPAEPAHERGPHYLLVVSRKRSSRRSRQRRAHGRRVGQSEQ